MKPTVLHVSPVFVPVSKEAGGVANVVRHLALNQSASGLFDVSILCSDTERQKNVSMDILESSVSGVNRFIVPQYRYSLAGPFWPVRRYLDEFISKKEGALLAHVHTCFSSMTDFTCRYLASRNIPFLLTPHGKTMPAFRGKQKYAKVLWSSFVRLSSSIDKAGAIGCFSQKEIDETIKYFRLGSNVKVFHTFNGFPACETESSSEYSPNQDRSLNILFLGYLDPRKNILNLLRSLPLVKSSSCVSLTIAGPDSYGHEKALRSEVRKLNLERSVHFAGKVDGPAKLRLYKASDVLVLPSSGEGQPLVLGEALSAGLPIIFSEYCNFSFAALQGAGVQLEGVEPEQIARSIDLLWSDRSFYDSVRKSALNLASLCSWRVASDYWLSSYDKILSSYGSRAG